MKDRNIRTSYPLLPPIEELTPYLEMIWKSGTITNNGEIEQLFEKELSQFLKVDHISLVSSGTSALMLALHVLNLKGDVITTPFSHISTAQALYWNRLTPVFADINNEDYNLDFQEVEKAITSKTTAILPVHVFGNPCDNDQFQTLAEKRGLKLIYDAAHCFGVEKENQSILLDGDLSIVSFHATKTFNTIEGGAIICRDRKKKERIDALKNNGINPQFDNMGYGFNAKLNEIQAAYGLVMLRHIQKAIDKRKEIFNQYVQLVSSIKGIRMVSQNPDIKYNYTYFPILIEPELFGMTRDQLQDRFLQNGVLCKTYFDPLITGYKFFHKFKTNPLTVAESIASNILCIPMHHQLQDHEVSKIIAILKKMDE